MFHLSNTDEKATSKKYFQKKKKNFASNVYSIYPKPPWKLLEETTSTQTSVKDIFTSWFSRLSGINTKDRYLYTVFNTDMMGLVLKGTNKSSTIAEGDPQQYVEACTALWKNGFFGASNLTGGELLSVDSDRRFTRKILTSPRINFVNVPEEYQLLVEECMFLMSGLGIMNVINPPSNIQSTTLLPKLPTPLTPQEFWKKFIVKNVELNKISLKEYDGLCIRIARYASYHYYRSNNWVVRPGTKMGSDWLLYVNGPPLDHSIYTVLVCPNMENIVNSPYKCSSQHQVPINLVLRASRVSNSVRKTLVIAQIVSSKSLTLEELNDPSCILKLSVWEVLFSRFRPEKFRE